MSFHLRGHQSRTRAQAVITRNSEGKVRDTKPELEVRKIVFDLGYDYLSYPPIVISDGMHWWTFTPDIQLLGTDVLIEVDGEYHHTHTQELKTRWRDKLLLKSAHRVIHVDAGLTKNEELKLSLRTKLREAIASNEKIVRIDA